MPTFKYNHHLGDKDPLVQTDDISNRAITTQKLANMAVTTEKIDINAVTLDKIKDTVPTFENGFFIVDENLNIGLLLTQDTFDTIGLSDYCKYAEVFENGLFVVDGLLNIGFELKDLSTVYGVVEVNENSVFVVDKELNIGFQYLPTSIEILEINEDGLYFVDKNKNVGYRFFTSSTSGEKELLEGGVVDLLNKENPQPSEGGYLCYENGHFAWKKISSGEMSLGDISYTILGEI